MSALARPEARQALADFVRHRRSRTLPEHVGLAAGARRRTPGLRREEVAQLAGVGLTWYTWLEQGRDISVSDQVLESIARALRLDSSETRYLFTLANRLTTNTSETHEYVSPNLKNLLANQGIYPAFITGRSWDILA